MKRNTEHRRSNKKIIAMLMATMLIVAMAVTAMASEASIAVDTVKQEAKIGDEVSVSVSFNLSLIHI